nr:unnamed protein product [Callosobruchus chinensis]
MTGKCERCLKFLSTPADVTGAKRSWQRKYTFPCSVGVIHCTHIRIKNSPLHGDEYINRKGYRRRMVYKRRRIMARICP